MGKLTENEKKIIDKYYDELNNEVDADADADAYDLLFEENFKNSIAKMDAVKIEPIDIPNNFFCLINKAEEIKQKKNFRREFIAFILIASFIISLFIVLILLVGPKLLIIFETIMFTLLPFSLIPLSRAALNRGESR